MALISDDIIAQVIGRCDIVETVGGYMALRRAGRNFKGLCPFHHEKTPSFVVNPDKQIFHCFGCGVGGNVISFVMRQDRLEFPEAVRALAEKVGIQITHADSGPRDDTRPLYKVNELAAQYFFETLIADKSPAAKAAREYLKGRQVSLEIVQKFQIGFAPEGWDGLLEFLKTKDIPINVIEKTGLIIANEKRTGFYDRFRNRVTFPIFDSKSRVLGFGARAMDDNPAKYINSPETSIYRKGEHLYGFQLSKEAIGRLDFAIVVEGYMDFIMPYQAGVHNIVASLGTALTVEQIRLLRRYTHNVVMLFDADPAGQSAIIRSLDILLEEDMNVKVAVLTNGEDPDSYVRKFGAEAFQKQIQNAKSLFDFKLEHLKGQYDSTTIEGRAKIAEEMIRTIGKLVNPMVKIGYLKRLSELLDFPESVLQGQMSKIGAPRTDSKPVAPKVSIEPQGAPRHVEVKILKFLLETDDFASAVKNEISVLDFQDDHIRLIVAKIFETVDKGGKVDVGCLINSFEDENIQRLISGLLAQEERYFVDPKIVMRECINRMIQDRSKSKRQQLLALIQQAERSGDTTKLDELKAQFNELVKK